MSKLSIALSIRVLDISVSQGHISVCRGLLSRDALSLQRA